MNTPGEIEAPRTTLEWVRDYRRLRRREYPAEDPFQRRVRALFRASSLAKLKGWTPPTWKPL